MRGPQPARTPSVAASYGKLPLTFEPNAGRMDASVRFIARGSGYELAFGRHEVVLALPRGAVRTRLIGASPRARVVGQAVQPGRLNSYVGKDPRRWVRGAHLYGQVAYRAVYPGVDLVYHGRQGALEYDFVAAPGSDPGRIAMRFGGASPRLDAHGNLRLGAAMQRRPVAYQTVAGKRVRVPAAFDLSSGRVGFRLGRYDHTRRLVIDPVLAYSTYLGSAADDRGTGIAIDSSRSAYVTGTVHGTLTGDTTGTKYTKDPDHPEYADAFVAKLSPDGSALEYVTYFGGSFGGVGQASTPGGIALDGSNNAYVAGTTSATDFPTTSGAFQENVKAISEGYVLKLNSSGALAWATYLGSANGNDSVLAIAVDGNGNSFVTGSTSASDFPHTTGGAFAGNDAFVTSVKPDGSGLNWSEFLGGSDLDEGRGIAFGLDSQAHTVLLVTGTSTYSGNTLPHTSDFPLGASPIRSTFGGHSEMFLATYNPADGARLDSTFLGGSSDDTAEGLTTVGSTAFVVGSSSSNDIMGSAGNSQGNRDAVVISVGSFGGTAVRYIGTSSDDYGNAIAHDPEGYGNALYVTGFMGGSGLAEVNPLQPASARDGRAFIAKISASNLQDTIYLSYLGGPISGPGYNTGTAVAVDPPDGGQNHFAAYFLGETSSTSFPTQSPEQPTNAGGRDVYLAKVGLATPMIDSGPSGAVGSTSVTFSFSSTESGLTYFCQVGAATDSNCKSPKSFNNLSQGPHTIYISGLDDGNAQTAGAQRDFIVDTVPPNAPELVSPDDGAKTDTQPTFTWKTSSDATTTVDNYRLVIDGAGDREVAASSCQDGTCSAQVSKALATGSHTWSATAIDSAGNVATATPRSFIAQQPPSARFTIAPNPALVGRTVTFDGSGSADASHTIVHYEWDLDGNGSFETDTGATPTTSHAYTAPGNVAVALRVTDSTGLSATVANNLLVTAQGGSGQLGVSINNGAQYTNDPNVVVTSVFPTGTTGLLFSNDGGFFAPSQFPARRETNWRLDSSGPERLPKIVYVRFLSGPIVSETHTDDIILDETPPKVQAASVAPAAGASSARVASVARVAKWIVRVKATDSNSGVGKLQVTANKRKPGRLLRYQRKLTVKSANRPKWVRARDRAGNFSRWRKTR